MDCASEQDEWAARQRLAAYRAELRSASPYRNLTPEDRYGRDTSFRMLVDYMLYMIQQADYTPTELREAALLAAIKHEYLSIKNRSFALPYRDPVGGVPGVAADIGVRLVSPATEEPS